MRKVLVLSMISVFVACGLQVRDPGTTTIPNPNTNGNPNTSGEGYTVGGHASGIPHHHPVKVTINGHEHDISENGTFTFPEQYPDETSYDVDIVEGPGGAYSCTLQNDAGTINGANVTNVELTCTCDNGSLGTGAGTSINPILIYTSAQLNGIANAANTTSMSKYYKQVCDLDYTGITPKPIGGNNFPFTGSYDGDNWFILNYTSGSSTASLNQNKGVFGKTQNAVLKNINLSNFHLTADSTMTTGRIGALAGIAAGTDIQDIYAEDITINDNGHCLDGVGGVIGNQIKYTGGSGACTAQAELNGVHIVRADITAANSQNVGGVFGTSNVDGTKNIQADDIHIHECSYQCGGIGGSLTGKSTFKDMNAQNVTVEGDERVGGITGLNYGVINRSAFVGTVNGKTTAGRFGGLIGYGTTMDPMTNSFAVADILSVVGTTTAGRVTGASAGITNVSYDNTQTCQNCSVSGGTAFGGSNSFKNGSNPAMASWDFDNVWCAVENDYPQLIEVPFSVCN